jgi:copper chaperone CopZ
MSTSPHRADSDRSALRQQDRQRCSQPPRFHGQEQENPTVVTQWFRIPQMSSRHGVRAISAYVSDVPGVRTVQARLDSQTLSVTGTADATAVQRAIRRAGYDAIPSDHPEPDGVAGTAAGSMEINGAGNETDHPDHAVRAGLNGWPGAHTTAHHPPDDQGEPTS